MARKAPTRRPIIMMVKPTIQFIQGTDELTVPNVRLTKSRGGKNGIAIFKFDQPSIFHSSGEVGDITGFYMIDEKGVLQSVDVSAKFVNGKPSRIEAKYIMRTPRAIISGLRTKGLVKIGPLAENLATSGAMDLPMTVPPNSSQARGLSVGFI